MSGGAFHLEVDGKPLTTTISSDSTGGRNLYKTVSAPTQSITSGSHKIRFVVDTSYFNIDWIKFESGTVSQIKPGNSDPILKQHKCFDMQGKHKGSTFLKDKQ